MFCPIRYASTQDSTQIVASSLLFQATPTAVSAPQQPRLTTAPSPPKPSPTLALPGGLPLLNYVTQQQCFKTSLKTSSVTFSTYLSSFTLMTYLSILGAQRSTTNTYILFSSASLRIVSLLRRRSMNFTSLQCPF